MDTINQIILTECIFDNDNKFNLKLKQWQEDMTRANSIFLESNNKSGVIIAPTGSGKSFMIGYEAIKYINKYKKNVLIFTKRKEIFINYENKLLEIYQKMKHNKMIDQNIIIYDCINNKRDFTIFTKDYNKNINNIFIINTDKFVKSKRFNNYQNYYFGNMGLFIHDECHWTSSQKIYDFLQYFKTNINCKLIGFSATPTRIIKDHQIKSYSIYGNQEEFNVIYQRSFMDAILDKDIAEINFKFFKINLQHVDKIKENNNDSTQNIRYIEQYQLNNIGMNKLLIYINEHVKKSVYGKGIIWFIDIESLKKFHKYYKSHLIKYSELVNFKFIETNSKCDDRDAINKFINIKRNCILLAVDQATEGFDDPRIDFGIRAYLAKSISPILEIQRMGRMMRIYNKKKSSTYITIENLEIEEFKDDWIKRMSNFTKYIQEFNNKSFFYNGIDYTIDQIIIKFMDLEQIECINKQETKELTLSNIINILNEHNFKNDKINWEEQYNIIAKKDVRLSKISMNDLRNNYFDKKNWYKIMKIDKQYYTFEELVKYFYEKNILK